MISKHNSNRIHANPDTLQVEQYQRHEWSVELLRGIAALMVVFAHYYTMAGIEPGLLKFSFSGVDLFFVISGFVFAPYLFGKRFRIIPFLIRRFFRIYPLYLVALLAYIGLHGYRNQGMDHITAHLFFLHTLESREIAFYYNPAFWSLPPEIEFYFFLPLLLLIAIQARHFAMVFLGALFMHLVIAYMTPDSVTEISHWTILAVHLPGMLIEFLLGGLVWYVITQSPTFRARVLLFLTGLFLWISLAHFFSLHGDGAIAAQPIFRGNMGLFAAVAYGLMLCGWIGFIKNPPCWLQQFSITLGNLSYGIYLFHNAVPAALHELSYYMTNQYLVLTYLVCTLLIAHLSHRHIEAPLRTLGRLWTSKITQSQ